MFIIIGQKTSHYYKNSHTELNSEIHLCIY